MMSLLLDSGEDKLKQKKATFVEQPQRVPVAHQNLIEDGHEVGRVHGNVLHQLPQLLNDLPHTQHTLKTQQTLVSMQPKWAHWPYIENTLL